MASQATRVIKIKTANNKKKMKMGQQLQCFSVNDAFIVNSFCRIPYMRTDTLWAPLSATVNQTKHFPFRFLSANTP